MSSADPISGVNNRRLKRWYLVMYLRVFDEDTGELLGHVVDINKQGIRLVSDKPIPSNQIFRLWVDVPKENAPRQRIHRDHHPVVARLGLAARDEAFERRFIERQPLGGEAVSDGRRGKVAVQQQLAGEVAAADVAREHGGSQQHEIDGKVRKPALRQIGNAVPPALAGAIATQVKEALENASERNGKKRKAS